MSERDPRFQKGGRFDYGTKEEALAELGAQGITSNSYGKLLKANGKLAQPLPVIHGMIEKVRQRVGFSAVQAWRSGRTANMAGECAICGGNIYAGQKYYTGQTKGQAKKRERRRAHADCVAKWEREVGNG